MTSASPANEQTISHRKQLGGYNILITLTPGKPGRSNPLRGHGGRLRATGGAEATEGPQEGAASEGAGPWVKGSVYMLISLHWNLRARKISKLIETRSQSLSWFTIWRPFGTLEENLVT